MTITRFCFVLLIALFAISAGIADGEARSGASGDLFLISVPDDQLEAIGGTLILEEKVGSGLYWARFAPAARGVLPAGVSRVAADREIKLGPALKAAIAAGVSERTIVLRIALPRSFSQRAVEEFTARHADILDNVEHEYANTLSARMPAVEIDKLVEDSAVLSVEQQRPRVLFNRRAANLSLVPRVSNDYGYRGSGVAVTVVDGGPAFRHREFRDRLTLKNGGDADDHATHVTGTIAAEGRRGAARGVAPEASIFSYSFNGNVFGKMSRSKNEDNGQIANNSWGLVGGWEYEPEFDPAWAWYGDETFGAYGSEARQADALIQREDVIVVFAGGNERDNTGPQAGEEYWDWATDSIKTADEFNPDGPYTCVGTISSAKNVITVGALRDNRGMTGFSSWGPTRDGRIKPEITANGHSLLSSVTGNFYDSYSGTSMAAPVVSGGLALVAESWREVHGGDLPVDVARALLAANAKDLGPAGPDYRYGFGIMDVYGMITSIERHMGGFVLQSRLRSGSDQRVYSFTVPEAKSTLHLAIAWIDPPAAVNADETLVNDLDMVLIAPDKDRHWPYILNPAKPSEPAKTGRNPRDTIELIVVENAGGKTYRVLVSSKRMASGPQEFAIAARYR